MSKPTNKQLKKILKSMAVSTTPAENHTQKIKEYEDFKNLYSDKGYAGDEMWDRIFLMKMGTDIGDGDNDLQDKIQEFYKNKYSSE